MGDKDAGGYGQGAECCVEKSVQNAAKYGGYSHKAYAKVSESVSYSSGGGFSY